MNPALRPVAAAVTSPLALLLYAAEPLLKPRLGRVIPERIGHLAANTHLFLRRVQLGRLPPASYTLFASGPAANETLLSVLSRQVPIRRGFAAKLFTACEPWLRATRFFVDLPIRSNEYDLFDGGRPTVSFTDEEERRGRAGLAALGLGPDDWFVPFHARDSGYLRASQPGRDFAYHDYRDCSVDHFRAAAEWVASRGGFAVRMGAGAVAPLSWAGPRVLDYATTVRDDFMDIYLAAKCRFFLGSDTGLTQVATVFDRPVVNTNVPIADWASFRAGDLFIQKRLREKGGRFLSYAEVFTRDRQRFYDGRILDKEGLELVENSPEDILEAAKELDARLSETWAPRPDDDELQARYRALFTPAHNCYGFRARLGADFLRRHAATLFPSRQGAPR